MTTMKRVTISIPEELDSKILKLRGKEEFCRDSYSEIARKLLDKGLSIIATPRSEESA